jgi:hypothetical protein
MQWGQSALLLMGAACVALGGWCMYAESGPVLRAGTTPLARLQAISSPQDPIGAGAATIRSVLLDCQQVLLSYDCAAMRLQPPQMRAELLDICDGLAHATLRHTPAHGQAEMILALVADQRGDRAAAEVHLARSQALEPGTAWLASQRVPVRERRFEELSEEAREWHLRDLSLLLHSEPGKWQLAQLYLGDEAARERIGVALQQVPEQLQTAFITAVRDLMHSRAAL